MRKIVRGGSLGLLAGVIAIATLMTGGVAGAATATPALPATHSTTAPLKWPITGPGSTGERVVAIQYLLNQQINAKLAVDGIYGPKTTAAVKAFQTKVKIPSDGIVGPMTYPLLIIKVIEGSKGDAVAAVQHNLRYSYGFTSLAVDGIFGPQTLAAVKSFQAKYGVAVSGQVGARTWNALIVNEK